MCVCGYVYTYIHIYIYALPLYIYICVCVCVYIYICRYMYRLTETQLSNKESHVKGHPRHRRPPDRRERCSGAGRGSGSPGRHVGRPPGRALGFRGLGFRGLGFRVLCGFKVEVLGLLWLQSFKFSVLYFQNCTAISPPPGRVGEAPAPGPLGTSKTSRWPHGSDQSADSWPAQRAGRSSRKAGEASGTYLNPIRQTRRTYIRKNVRKPN